MVWDGAGARRSGQLRVIVSMQQLILPSCSPDFNPVERWFQEVRWHLFDRIFPSITELKTTLTAMIRPYWNHPAGSCSSQGTMVAPYLHLDILEWIRYQLHVPGTITCDIEVLNRRSELIGKSQA